MSEFTYCLNTSTIRPAPLLEKVAIAGRTGYAAIEPWNEEVDSYLGQGGTIDELRRALADAGLSVASMIALGGWCNAEGEAYDQAIDECRRRMSQAVALGGRYVVASPPQEVVDLRRAAERFGDLVRIGRALGVEPTMEFLGFVEGVKDVATAERIATRCGEPGATIVADVFHMMRGGGSIDDLLTLRGDRLANFHLNDLPADPDPLVQTDHDRVMIGEGIADLPRVIANLRAIGYRGALSLELFNRSLWEKDPEEVARIGLERMRALVE